MHIKTPAAKYHAQARLHNSYYSPDLQTIKQESEKIMPNNILKQSHVEY